MWLKTAQELRGYRNVVGYDLMVEPNTGGHPERWNDLARSIIGQLRSADAETPILLEGADGGTPQALCTLSPLVCAGGGTGGGVQDYDRTGNLVYAVHQYEPTNYTQQTEGDWQFECKLGKKYLKDKKGEPDQSRYVGFGAGEEARLREVYSRLGEELRFMQRPNDII